MSASPKDLEDTSPRVEDEEHGSEIEGDILEGESTISRHHSHTSTEERTYRRRPRMAESSLMAKLKEGQDSVGRRGVQSLGGERTREKAPHP